MSLPNGKVETVGIGVGLLGCGVVGAAVARGLDRVVDACAPRLAAVAVRDLSKARECDLGVATVTPDAVSVVDDPGVDIVVEVLGGIEPAASLVRRALALGKPVVTANKAVLGAFGPHLHRCAADLGVPLLFEGAVAGGVPVIRGLSGLARADEFVKIEAVLNGTTTFVLSYVEQTGATFAEALAEARRLGFAEADSTRDMDGSDAADKLAVLVQYLFGQPLLESGVHRVGIDVLSRDDVLAAPDRRWRLVATAVRDRCARVEPVALRADHPFATLQGVSNAITVTGLRSGPVTFIGAGAGGDATACSVIADILFAADWVSTTRRETVGRALATTG